jgi:hypothetical protein
MTDCKPLNAIRSNVRLIDGSMRSGEPAAEASETTQNHFSDMRLPSLLIKAGIDGASTQALHHAALSARS